METLLAMLKTDLGISASTTAYDERLTQYLNAAKESIIREGATTISTADPADMQIIVMYAAWLFRRRDSMDGMPRMLRMALNNRVFAQKAGD